MCPYCRKYTKGLIPYIPTEYSVKIKYSVINENEILCEFEGDIQDKTIYRKVDLFDNGEYLFSKN